MVIASTKPRVRSHRPSKGIGTKLRLSGFGHGKDEKVFYTPGSGEHGPRFLTGGPGAAPGGVASKNGWVYMRVQGGFNLHGLFCVSAH